MSDLVVSLISKHIFLSLCSAAWSLSQLESLQSHFTWGLECSRFQLLLLQDRLEDIGVEQGYSWLGHIYNLQGYLHQQLGQAQDAQRLLCRAAEAFRQMRNTVSDEGPWLVVNYGNRAWLHHLQGEHTESQLYLSKVEELLSEYPSPSPDQLHPEICAEKAWTLMKFSRTQRLHAVRFFQRAIRMQPDVVEWHSSHVMALYGATNDTKEVDADILEKMKIAKEHDPENLYLAALYLEASAKRGRNVQQEVRELARRVLRKPVSSYSGLKPLLRLYQIHVSMDEAIDLAEEALERHPDQRYLKSCAAICYEKRILMDKDHPPDSSMLSRAISLCKEVVSLYPHSSLKTRIALANIYAASDQKLQADRTYTELLASDLDPAGQQILHNCYAKYVHHVQKEKSKSIEYHMMAAEIPVDSYYRQDSIRILHRIRERNRNRMCAQIEQFLLQLQE